LTWQLGGLPVTTHEGEEKLPVEEVDVQEMDSLGESPFVRVAVQVVVCPVATGDGEQTTVVVGDAKATVSMKEPAQLEPVAQDVPLSSVSPTEIVYVPDGTDADTVMDIEKIPDGGAPEFDDGVNEAVTPVLGGLTVYSGVSVA
jgi:hypothetical protein